MLPSSYEKLSSEHGNRNLRGFRCLHVDLVLPADLLLTSPGRELL